MDVPSRQTLVPTEPQEAAPTGEFIVRRATVVRVGGLALAAALGTGGTAVMMASPQDVGRRLDAVELRIGHVESEGSRAAESAGEARATARQASDKAAALASTLAAVDARAGVLDRQASARDEIIARLLLVEVSGMRHIIDSLEMIAEGTGAKVPEVPDGLTAGLNGLALENARGSVNRVISGR